MAIEIAPLEPDSPDDRKRSRARRMLWRLSAWGGAAAPSLAALAITSQTERGSERLQYAIARAIQPETAVAKVDVAPRVIGIDRESLRLEAQLHVLAADRDRLMARIASLEHNLDDMTGSIKKQTAEAPKTPAPSHIAPLAMPAATGTATAWPAAASAQAVAPALETVPLPPTRIATAPANETAAEPPRKPELGIDLGGAATMDALNARWVALKVNFGPLIAGLHPLARHNSRPGSTDYRLLVGPLPNAAAAANLCARFSAARVNCRTTKYDGERLAQY
ncbi:MAG: hypothetical protein EXQ82_06865 [Pseudolabrys sp.]|nr:hypothetical protein [Pseudolabrys sp.]